MVNHFIPCLYFKCDFSSIKNWFLLRKSNFWNHWILWNILCEFNYSEEKKFNSSGGFCLKWCLKQSLQPCTSCTLKFVKERGPKNYIIRWNFHFSQPPYFTKYIHIFICFFLFTSGYIVNFRLSWASKPSLAFPGQAGSYTIEGLDECFWRQFRIWSMARIGP